MRKKEKKGVKGKITTTTTAATYLCYQLNICANLPIR